MKISAPIPQGILVTCLACFATVSFAQVTTSNLGSNGWAIKPRITLTETLTDNGNINRNGNNQVESITELAPGLRVDARTARLNAYFDYALRGQFYAKNSDNNRNQNSLNTFGTFTAIENWLFLDFSGVIAQQSISAFGTQSPGSDSVNSNSTETSTYRLSPYLRGQLAGSVDYLLRYSLSTTKSGASTVSDIDTSQWSGQLTGGTPFQFLKWNITGSQQTTEYARGRKTDAENLRAMLTYSVLPELQVSLSGGLDTNNYASQNQDTSTTYGYGFAWSPTERTKFSVFKEHRFFGEGHKIDISHRFPMSSIQFSDSRDVSVLPSQFSTTGRGTYYDLYYQQCNQQLMGSITDPTQLAIASDACANTLLAQTGVSSTTQVTSGFATSQATIRRSQQLSFALFGARNSITLLVNRTENESLVTSQSTNDDLAKNSSVKQQGVSLNLSHQLTELSNLNFLASRQESTGNATNTVKTTTTLYQINFATKLGAKTTGALSARHSEFDSTTPFTENALIGTVSYNY